MIHEYAVNPEMLLDERLCGLLATSFGVSRARLVSQFPKHWESLVWTALADAKPLAKKKIEEALARLSRRTFPRFHEWADGEWLDEAVREHSARPFRAILSQHRHNGCRDVLAQDDLDEANSLWNVETSRSCPRSAIEMRRCAELLLACAEEILFIDPYFDPTEERFRNPLKEFLACVKRRRTGVPIMRVEYHTVCHGATAEWFRAKCDDAVAKLVLAGIAFRIIRWHPHPDLHNRYILTNRGGLIYGNGLDENLGGTDQVCLLSTASHTDLWAAYQPNTSKYMYADDWWRRST